MINMTLDYCIDVYEGRLLRNPYSFAYQGIDFYARTKREAMCARIVMYICVMMYVALLLINISVYLTYFSYIINAWIIVDYVLGKVSFYKWKNKRILYAIYREQLAIELMGSMETPKKCQILHLCVEKHPEYRLKLFKLHVRIDNEDKQLYMAPTILDRAKLNALDTCNITYDGEFVSFAYKAV